MFPGFWSFLPFLLPVLMFATILFFPQLFGGKFLNKTIQRSERWQQQSTDFQEQLLVEMRRHNAVMEQQSQLVALLLERSEQ
ncbi:MAG: hypothetical protein ACRYFS_16110 [Janthinobacterium lividum]